MSKPAARTRDSRPRRSPNRRGEGGRLRDELITAAVTMIERPGELPPSLRAIAREAGIAATSVYLHFPDVDHLLVAVTERCFEQLTLVTNQAASEGSDPLDELRLRCRAYCHFGLDHPRLYQVMFSDIQPPLLAADPADTPGRRSFANLVRAVQRCLETGAAPPHEDPFRLASLIWTAEHGIVLARISRPTFPWAPLNELVDEMIDRMMAVGN
jgi:AcrR family transcriptional regulator